MVRPLVQPAPGAPLHRVLDPVARIEFLTRLRPDARLYALPPPGCRANQKWGRRLPPPPSGGRWSGPWQEGEGFIYGRQRQVRWKEQVCLWWVAGAEVPVKLIFDSIQPQPLVVQAFADLDRGVAPGSDGGAAGSGAACCTVGGTCPGCAEDRAAGALQVAPQQEPLAVLLDFHHLQSIQVLDHIGPLEVVSIPGQPSLQFLAQRRLVGFSPIPDSTAFTNRECQRYGPIDLFQKGPCQADLFLRLSDTAKMRVRVIQPTPSILPYRMVPLSDLGN